MAIDPRRVTLLVRQEPGQSVISREAIRDYYGNVLTGSGTRNGESGKPWRGVDPTPKNRHWAIPGAVISEIDEDFTGHTQHEKLDRLYELGYIKIIPGQAWPIYERYVSPDDGTATPDIWAYQPYTNGTVFGTEKGVDEDIRWLSPKDQERLGYQTQKPLALLKRIILASSNPGDVVLDPFCGCGTAIYAAQELSRTWLGIDITCLATNLIKNTLLRYRLAPGRDYHVIGEPRDLQSARNLISTDPKRRQFEYWALGLIGARPWGGKQKEGADGGRDGLFFFEDTRRRHGVVSVKSGRVGVKDVRELSDVVRQERADIGVLITMEEPTDPMKAWAADAGYYDSPLKAESVHRIQILSIADLIQKKEMVQFPRGCFLIAAEEAKLAREPKPKQEVLLPSEEESVTAKKPSRSRQTKTRRDIPPGQRVMLPTVEVYRAPDSPSDDASETGLLPTSRAAKKKRTA